MKPIDMLLVLLSGAFLFFWVVMLPIFVVAKLAMPQVFVWYGVIVTVGLGVAVLRKFDPGR